MATKFGCFTTKLAHRLRHFHLAYFGRSTLYPMTCFYRFVAVRVNSLFTHLCYFLSLSFVGYCVLKSITTRPGAAVPRSIDFFYTAVSAATDSSMSAVEMEVFSDSHLLFITFLMFVGGEVFVSLVGLLVKTSRMRKPREEEDERAVNGGPDPTLTTPRQQQLELTVVATSSTGTVHDEAVTSSAAPHDDDVDDDDLKYKSVQLLSYVVLGYIIVAHFIGISFLSLYLALESSARNVLREKRLKSFTFSLFTIVSTFASCGFVPTNENMIVFRKNTVMLLIVVPHVLFGNALFPSCLRLCVWFVGKVSKGKSEQRVEYLLRNTREVGFYHLLPGRQSIYLAATVAGFVAVQFALFCGMDWNSEGMSGMNTVEKLGGALFLTVNSRHSGETIVDLATVSMAVLVVFVVMMYLPPYTSFLPTKKGAAEEEEKNDEENVNTYSDRMSYKNNNKSNKFVENVIFSQLSYLVLFIVLICITERKSMKEDPLNFNVFNIVLEIISAYGNVGFSMGYSCKRQVNHSGNCQDKFYSFSGKWSDEGKIVLILVMLFGRLKKFNMDGGKAWKLL